MPRTTEGRIKKRGQAYYADFTYQGKRHRELLRDDDGNPITNKAKAEKALDKRLHPLRARDAADRHRQVADRQRHLDELADAADDAARPRLRIADAWQEYVDAPNRPDSGPATMKDYRSHWRKLEAWAESQGLDVLETLTPDHAESFARTLRDLSPNRQNKILNTCSRTWAVLQRRHGLPDDPFTAEHVGRRRLDTKGRRELSENELRTVTEAAEGELRALLAIGLYTGLRLKDAVLLEWADVDLRRNVITSQPHKTRRRTDKVIHVPLHPVLKAVLQETPAGDRGQYVVPELATLYRRGRWKVSRKVQQLFEDAGIDVSQPGTGYQRDADGRKVHTGKRSVCEVGFHSLRHSFVSLCENAGVPESIVRELVGHGSPAMTRKYYHMDPAAAAVAVGNLPDVTTDAPQIETDPEREELAELAQTAPLKAVQEALAILRG